MNKRNKVWIKEFQSPQLRVVLNFLLGAKFSEAILMSEKLEAKISKIKAQIKLNEVHMELDTSTLERMQNIRRSTPVVLEALI